MVNENYTHIALIADRSGSMANIAEDMNGGMGALLEEQAKLPGKLLVDVTVFDTIVDTLYSDATVSEVRYPFIIPRGSTALLDAVGSTVVTLGEKLAGLPEEERPGKVIVVIVTDGYENASREYTAQRVKELVTQQKEKYSWEFLFLGANIDSFSVAGSWGISKGSTINYSTTSAGVNSVLRGASAYMTSTRTNLAYEFTEEDRQAASQ